MANTLTLRGSASRRTVLSRGPSLQPARPTRPRVSLPLQLRFARLDCREVWPPIALWLKPGDLPCSVRPVPPPIAISVSERTLRSAERVSHPLSLFAASPRSLPRLGGVWEHEGSGQAFAFVGSAASDCRALVRLMPLIDVRDPRAAGLHGLSPLDIEGHRGHGQRVECRQADGTTRQYFLVGPCVELVAIYDVDGYRALLEREAASRAKMRLLRQARECTAAQEGAVR